MHSGHWCAGELEGLGWSSRSPRCVSVRLKGQRWTAEDTGNRHPEAVPDWGFFRDTEGGVLLPFIPSRSSKPSRCGSWLPRWQPVCQWSTATLRALLSGVLLSRHVSSHHRSLRGRLQLSPRRNREGYIPCCSVHLFCSSGKLMHCMDKTIVKATSFREAQLPSFSLPHFPCLNSGSTAGGRCDRYCWLCCQPGDKSTGAVQGSWSIGSGWLLQGPV